MPTINFDWSKWNDSQWFGYPKNGNWAKYPQWEADAVSSNHEAYSAEVGSLKQAHRFAGYKSDEWFDLEGDVGDDTWMDHTEEVVAVHLSDAPVITEVVPGDGEEDAAFTHTFAAGGTAPIVWSLGGDVPAGLTLNASTGVLAGTPTESGDFDMTVTATNAKGSDDFDFTLTIEAA